MSDRFDKHDLRAFERFAASPAGRFALETEARLLGRLVSSWPRRGRGILDIGCGAGSFLEVFHQLGFDVTGIDASPVMVEAARARLGKNSDIHLGLAEHLPFYDNEFDFSCLITVLEFVHSPENVLREAMRVSRKGVLVACMNRLSLYHITNGPMPWNSQTSRRTQGHWFFPWEIRSLIRRVAGPNKALRSGSVLLGSPSTWKAGRILNAINAWTLPLPIGSFYAVTVNLFGDPLTTPLYSWKTEPGLPVG
ncbi:class I SAM-dependent methyltransferase [Desulfovibrio inopinatus]|uniref:class I SAM-dependent methyltransferase n=1 Tax=Desulfovibrio inopinatus TaxID=102109 RepID=UPI0003FD22CB|nr:class I SAM-dependent methyltransferase [Desulfovibrio inopinatus]